MNMYGYFNHSPNDINLEFQNLVQILETKGNKCQDKMDEHVGAFKEEYDKILSFIYRVASGL